MPTDARFTTDAWAAKPLMIRAKALGREGAELGTAAADF